MQGSPAACCLGGGCSSKSSELFSAASAPVPAPFLESLGEGWAAQMRAKQSSPLLPGTCCATLCQKFGAVGSSATRYALCMSKITPQSADKHLESHKAHGWLSLIGRLALQTGYVRELSAMTAKARLITCRGVEHVPAVERLPAKLQSGPLTKLLPPLLPQLWRNQWLHLSLWSLPSHAAAQHPPALDPPEKRPRILN